METKLNDQAILIGQLYAFEVFVMDVTVMSFIFDA